jgi:hypothetical protein
VRYAWLIVLTTLFLTQGFFEFIGGDYVRAIVSLACAVTLILALIINRKEKR